VHYFPQFRVLQARRDPSNSLDELYVGVQQAFTQNTLPDHAGTSEKKYVHAYDILNRRTCLVHPEAASIVFQSRAIRVAYSSVTARQGAFSILSASSSEISLAAGRLDL